jgi:hypothetical protein
LNIIPVLRTKPIPALLLSVPLVLCAHVSAVDAPIDLVEVSFTQCWEGERGFYGDLPLVVVDVHKSASFAHGSTEALEPGEVVYVRHEPPVPAVYYSYYGPSELCAADVTSMVMQVVRPWCAKENAASDPVCKLGVLAKFSYPVLAPKEGP